MGHLGPLTRKVMQYQDFMKQFAPTARGAQDWASFANSYRYHFERIGKSLLVHDWYQYTEMFSQWAHSIDTFETTVKRLSEQPDLVHFEIAERHI